MKIISSELYVKDNKVYHEGNKPKPKDIGAAPETHTHNYASATTPGGSAEHAIKATEDSLGQRIDKYIKGLSVSGRTITYTRGDGTTGTITTQDNNTDTKVTNTLNTTAKAYITGTTESATNTGTQVFDTNVYLDTTAGMLTATTFKGALQGNATTATSATSASHAARLTTPRTINGTNFDGTTAITTSHWGTARTLTIGNTGKSVNGSGNVSWSIGEIGAAPAVHNHTSLTGITNLSFATDSTDSGSITTTVDGTNTYFDFNLSDDPTQNDMWRWRFAPSGGTLFNAMTLDAISTTEAKLAVTGEVQATRLKGTLTGNVTGNVTGTVSGNAGSATKLATPRAINGTNFDGSAAITTANWGTARTLTVGNASKSVNGSANISWTLDEMGAASRSPFSNTYKQITVGGDANTYYPVLITMNRPGIGYPWYNISISRAYNATAPDTWNNATHRGGLTFQFRWSGDTGWGGNDHSLQVVEFHESYTTMVAGFTLSVNGIVVWLRGGGALYQLNCEQGIGINATVTLGTYTSADDKTYPVRTNTSSVANEIHKLWVQRGGQVYDNNSRVYSANNKPTPADIGAAASSHTHNYAGSSSAGGAANSANTLATARTINGTSFNGSANITTVNWGTARTLTIGNTGKSVNGSGNVSWTLSEIGAAAASHTHSYLPLSGGTLTGNVTISTDSKLEWNRNTDYARISFKNTGDDDSDSYMHFLTGDNGNEYFKFSSLSGSTTTDLLTIKTDHLRYKGNAVYHAGNPQTSVSGNAGTATTLQTARTINGTSFNGSGNITTANWGTARTLTIGAAGKSVNGSGNVSWTWNEMAVPRSYGNYGFGGNQNAITTAQFITLLTNVGAFNQFYWISRGSWSYAGNQIINDTGCGNIHLAGSVVEVIGTSANYTIRVTTPTTGSGTNNAEFIYVNNGADYSPGWRRQYNTKNKPTPAEIGAASTAVATTSANGLMSKADKSKLDSIATNAQFKMTVTSSSWTADGSLYSTTINHNLNKEVLYVSAYDSSSKKSIFVSYTIINNNSLKVTVESAINAVITIVVEGGLINLAAGGISDSTTAANTTWSSTKIQSAINAAVKDGTTSQKGIVQLSSATNSTSTTLAATASAVKAAYDLANTANNTANTIKNSTNNNRTITMSTANPSGGKNGDIWFKYE